MTRLAALEDPAGSLQQARRGIERGQPFPAAEGHHRPLLGWVQASVKRTHRHIAGRLHVEVSLSLEALAPAVAAPLSLSGRQL